MAVSRIKHVTPADAGKEDNLNGSTYTMFSRLHSGQPPAVANVQKSQPTEVSQKAHKAHSINSNFLGSIVNVCHGVIFWSLLTSLGPSLWYFPLWDMGFSGFEFVILAPATSLWLGSFWIRQRVRRKTVFLHMSSLVGLSAWLVPYPLERLLVLSLGVAMHTIVWAERLHNSRGQPQVYETATAWIMGLTLSSIFKMANHTTYPLWPITNPAIGGWNTLGLALSTLASMRSVTYSTTTQRLHAPPPRGPVRSLMAGFGFGGLLFLLHAFLSDSSTIIAWVWNGYPITGPRAIPHGAFIILAMNAGTLWSISSSQHFESWGILGLACLGATTLVLLDGWVGFAGGLILAVYATAIAPTIVASAAASRPALAFGVGFLFYTALVLLQVVLVAYPFFPGGQHLRERTDFMVALTMASLGIGIWASRDSIQIHQPRFCGKFRQHCLYFLCVLQILSLLVVHQRLPTNKPRPYHADNKLITAGVWTVHFSLDNRMWSSERSITAAIRDLELDVVGLLETDLQRINTGNRDMTQYIGETLGMYVDYGPGPDKHTWGCALLSKFPIISSTHHLLPSPTGLLAPAISATLDVYGHHVDTIVYHAGLEEHPIDLQLQSEYLAQLFAKSENPIIFLGYIVTKPHEGNYHNYVNESNSMKDIDVTDRERWCQYIFYKGLKRTAYARISRARITDTEIQAGKFVLEDEASDSNERVAEALIPASRRFPDSFKGRGIRGHRYHVINGPRYFA